MKTKAMLIIFLVILVIPSIVLALPAFKDIDGTLYYPLDSYIAKFGGEITVNRQTLTTEIQSPAGLIEIPVEMPAVFIYVNGERKLLPRGIFEINVEGRSVMYVPEMFFEIAGFPSVKAENIVRYDEGQAGGNGNISVFLNEQRLQFDVPPAVINGRTLVPLRTIFESLGASVAWEGTTQTVTATQGDRTISLTIGNAVAYVNGVPMTLQVPGRTISGRTLVPLRFIGESLGAKVDWDSTARTVRITH